MPPPPKSATTLFNDDDDEEDDAQYDFSHKQHLEGEKGRRLMALQSKFKHDQRFAMNERFLDSESEEEKDKDEQPPETSTNDYEQEKEMELGVLEEILGHVVVKKRKSKDKGDR